MDNLSAGDVGGIFAGVVAVLTALGGAIAWLLNWHGERSDRKSAQLKEWEDSLARREKEQREVTEGRLAAVEQSVRQLDRAFNLAVWVTHIMVDDLIVMNPRRASLGLVLSRINETYPVPEDMPDELANLAARLSAGKEIEP
tara:strand:- start:341 stop:766 length:426 start_codon:yes stop_codon:yes gene_type:complete